MHKIHRKKGRRTKLAAKKRDPLILDFGCWILNAEDAERVTRVGLQIPNGEAVRPDAVYDDLAIGYGIWSEASGQPHVGWQPGFFSVKVSADDDPSLASRFKSNNRTRRFKIPIRDSCQWDRKVHA